MKNIIAEDHETKHLKLSDVDVLTVYQYIVARDTNKDDRYTPVLVTEPYIEIIYKPSEKLAKEIKERDIRRHLLSFDSDIYIQNAKLSDFETYNDERLNAFNHAEDFINGFSKSTYKKGLYIYGAYGTGKTYLLSAIAHALAEKEIHVLFVSMPDASRSIREGFNDRSLEERINELKQADVLMLDDLGGESSSAWFRDEVLLPVLQYRLSASLPVFISSNLSMKDLTNFYAHTKNETDMVKSVRIIQRIKDLTTYVALTESKFED